MLQFLDMFAQLSRGDSYLDAINCVFVVDGGKGSGRSTFFFVDLCRLDVLKIDNFLVELLILRYLIRIYWYTDHFSNDSSRLCSSFELGLRPTLALRPF